jgi:hypothetical protein
VIGVQAAATHLLAAGAATLLVVTLGFRLLPRFFGTYPTRRSAVLVLPAAAIAPGLVAAGFVDDRFLPIGAALLLFAIVSFTIIVFRMWIDAERRRIGLYAVLPSTTFGVIGVSLGSLFAVSGASSALIATHLRVNLLGFLGLMIVGTSFQFYPPQVGTLPGSSNRAAATVIAILACGLAVEVLAAVAVTALAPVTVPLSSPMITFGHWLTLSGAVGYGYLIVSAFTARSD